MGSVSGFGFQVWFSVRSRNTGASRIQERLWAGVRQSVETMGMDLPHQVPPGTARTRSDRHASRTEALPNSDFQLTKPRFAGLRN